MNKSQLIEAVSISSGLTKADSGRVLDALLNTVSETLAKGDEITLTGFGRFHVKNKAERQGRNPQSGRTITIPASQKPTFSPGKSLKDAVN